MASERVVKAVLTVQMQNYIAGMEKAAESTRKTATEAQKLAAQGEAFTKLGTIAVATGALMAVGLGVAITKFADFDEAMSNVQAATQETSANMDILREAALEAGASTVFSATEAANAIEELGKNGLTTAQIIGGGLDSALSLASAGQLDVARAAEIAAITMKQFNLEAEQLPHVADLLAAGAGKAAGDVEDLAQALNQTALVASSTGLSIEETTGTLAAFADAGLIGSDAGTSFKSMLQRLTPVSGEAAAEMERLGISAYDAQGNFIGVAEFAGVLETQLADLTVEQRNAALAQIFGSDAVRAANVLYDEGAEGIAKYIEQTNDSGYAAKVAADRLNNLKGDVEQLGGALDTALIKTGSGANDSLRALTQGATGLVTAIGALPAPVLGGVGALTGLVAIVALTGGAALIAVPKLAQFKIALTTLNISGASAARGIGLATGALAGAGIAFSLWASYQAEATATASEFKESLDKTTGAVTSYTRELIATKLAEADAFKAAKEAGIGRKELIDGIIEGGDALEKINNKFAKTNTLATFFSGVGIESGLASQKVRDLATGVDRAGEILEDEAAAADTSAESTSNAGTAYQDAAAKADELQGNIRELIDTINEANGVGQDAVSTNAAYQAALAGIGEEVAAQKAAYEELNGTLDGFTLSLDETTVSGSANAEMLSDVAGKAQDAALAQLELETKTIGSKAATDNYMGTLANQRQAFIDSALAAGFDADQVQILTDKVFAMPSEKEVKILADAAAAQGVVDNFIWSNDGRRINLIVDGVVGRQVSGNQMLIDSGKADGGAIYGPGSGTSDTAGIYALSNGEHVLTAADVAAMGGQNSVYNFRDSLHGGGSAPAPSLDGVAITGRLEIGGDGLARIIDGRIVQSNGDRTRSLEAGMRP